MLIPESSGRAGSPTPVRRKIARSGTGATDPRGTSSPVTLALRRCPGRVFSSPNDRRISLIYLAPKCFSSATFLRLSAGKTRPAFFFFNRSVVLCPGRFIDSGSVQSLPSRSRPGPDIFSRRTVRKLPSTEVKGADFDIKFTTRTLKKFFQHSNCIRKTFVWFYITQELYISTRSDPKNPSRGHLSLCRSTTNNYWQPLHIHHALN